MTALQILAGLSLLFIGGETFVRGATEIAKRLGMSQLLIGLTLVGFGTSTPELLTSVKAALAGSPGVAVGNVVGSNIANVLLILGAAAILYPLNSNLHALKRDGAMMLAGALLCVAIGLYGVLLRLIGIGMIALLVAYIAFAYVSEKRNASLRAPSKDEPDVRPMPLGKGLVYAIAGLAMVMFGADWLVRGSIALSLNAGISETVIGLTIVAVGTSLPELAISVIAAFRRNADIAIGNIIGSNIYNVFGILGVTALIQPIAMPDRIANADAWIMLGITLLFLIFAATGAKITRREGAFFLVAYGIYLIWLGVEASAAGSL